MIALSKKSILGSSSTTDPTLGVVNVSLLVRWVDDSFLCLTGMWGPRVMNQPLIIKTDSKPWNPTTGVARPLQRSLTPAELLSAHWIADDLSLGHQKINAALEYWWNATCPFLYMEPSDHHNLNLFNVASANPMCWVYLQEWLYFFQGFTGYNWSSSTRYVKGRQFDLLIRVWTSGTQWQAFPFRRLSLLAEAFSI